jgi:hypothetical protein
MAYPLTCISGVMSSPVVTRDAAERRQVTVMFSDLVGSTALAGRMDPDARSFGLSEVCHGDRARAATDGRTSPTLFSGRLKR